MQSTWLTSGLTPKQAFLGRSAELWDDCHTNKSQECSLFLLFSRNYEFFSRPYLIIKAIVLTGVSVSELLSMTVENVERGWVKCGEELHKIPIALKQELLSHAKRNGIYNGPLFPGNSKGSLHRSRVTTTINRLAGPAHVDEDKCNPPCLRRLYQETQSQLREMAQALVDQSQERMIEGEQRVSHPGTRSGAGRDWYDLGCAGLSV